MEGDPVNLDGFGAEALATDFLGDLFAAWPAQVRAEHSGELFFGDPVHSFTGRR
jgi:hypothetical protein